MKKSRKAGCFKGCITGFFWLIFIFFILSALSECGDDNNSYDDGYIYNPLDTYIKKYESEKQYSIILEDMDVQGTFHDRYMHKYKVILQKKVTIENGVDSLGDTKWIEELVPQEEILDWVEVSDSYFRQNENNLGMTVLSKDANGKISKVAQPAGYQYVGDKRYGEWRTHNGNSFWAFYGQYMFMNSMFGMMSRPVYYNDYNAYRTGGYYGNRPYYGPKNSTGGHMYGTNSAQTKKERPNFFSRKASKSNWSGSRSRSGGSRSRGSGFGK